MTEQEFRKKLAENLILYRKLNGFTQAELAQTLGYSDKSVSKWERGDGLPDTYTLLSIAEIYGVELSELVGQTDKSKKTAEKIKAAEKNRRNTLKAKKKALDRAKKRVKDKPQK